MAPEISHRCPSCGASVRERDALFCPECGKSLSKPAVDSNAAASIETKPAEPISSSSTSEAGGKPQVIPDSSTTEVLPSAQPPIAENSTSTAKPKDDGATAHSAHRRGEKTRERLHRASEVARGVTRGVMEEPAKRVERIRNVSTTVIEEASYDPSLRFVLVALTLFVVFVILLVLSKVMG